MYTLFGEAVVMEGFYQINKWTAKKKKKKVYVCVTQMCYRSTLASLSAEGKEKENHRFNGKAHRSAAAELMHHLFPDLLSAEVLERESKERLHKKKPYKKETGLGIRPTLI